MAEIEDSRTMREVQALKAACWKDVEGLPFREALRRRLRDSEEAWRRAGCPGVPVASPRPDLALQVAERQGRYRVARDRK